MLFNPDLLFVADAFVKEDFIIDLLLRSTLFQRTKSLDLLNLKAFAEDNLITIKVIDVNSLFTYVSISLIIFKNVLSIRWGECNTILSAYTKYRHLG